MRVQGRALTFPPFSAFGARLQLAGRCDRSDSSFRTYVIFFSQNGWCLPFTKNSRSCKGSNKAESAGAKGQRKAWRAAFHDLYGCPPTFNITGPVSCCCCFTGPGICLSSDYIRARARAAYIEAFRRVIVIIQWGSCPYWINIGILTNGASENDLGNLESRMLLCYV